MLSYFKGKKKKTLTENRSYQRQCTSIKQLIQQFEGNAGVLTTRHQTSGWPKKIKALWEDRWWRVGGLR